MPWSPSSPKLARHPRKYTTHASTLARHPRHPCWHTTHPTIASTPATQARHPSQHATQASTPPTQAHHPRHPRQHVYHTISQTLSIRCNKKSDEQLIDKCMKADRKMTVLIRAKDYLDINKIRVLFKKTLNLSLLLSVHLAFSLVELQVK